MSAEKKLSRRHHCLGAILALAIAFLAIDALASPVQAQASCGSMCSFCEDNSRHKGTSPDPERGLHQLYCVSGSWCRACGYTPFAAPSGSSVLSAIQRAAPEDVPELVAPYMDRLLLHEGRNLLAIRGSTCQTDQLIAVVFLTRDVTLAVRKAGAHPLQDFADTALIPDIVEPRS